MPSNGFVCEFKLGIIWVIGKEYAIFSMKSLFFDFVFCVDNVDNVNILQAQFIERALDTKDSGVADVGVDLRGPDAGVAKDFLYQTNVNSIFK